MIPPETFWRTLLLQVLICRMDRYCRVRHSENNLAASERPYRYSESGAET